MPGGKVLPVVVLTREVALKFLTNVTVAPITSTIRGIAVEVPVGEANGLDHDSVVNLDNVMTIRLSELSRPIGFLSGTQDIAVAAALIAAFDLEVA